MPSPARNSDRPRTALDDNDDLRSTSDGLDARSRPVPFRAANAAGEEHDHRGDTTRRCLLRPDIGRCVRSPDRTIRTSPSDRRERLRRQLRARLFDAAPTCSMSDETIGRLRRETHDGRIGLDDARCDATEARVTRETPMLLVSRKQQRNDLSPRWSINMRDPRSSRCPARAPTHLARRPR